MFVIAGNILRPVLLVAPFASSLIAKLASESPDKYCCLEFGTQCPVFVFRVSERISSYMNFEHLYCWTVNCIYVLCQIKDV